MRVWSLVTNAPIHRLAAHDNSVTSLQFDDARIVSGGSDGRVKIWDLNTGTMVRELSQPAEAVWRVAFESERCVVLASRSGRTVMEVWDFCPQELEGEGEGSHDADDEAGLELSTDAAARPGGEETDAEMVDVESEDEERERRKRGSGTRVMDPFPEDDSEEEMTD